MSEFPDAIVVTEKKENVKTMKEKAQTSKTVFECIYEAGDGITKVASKALIISLFSPFDFEGPVIEIVSAVATGIGLLTKIVGKTGIKISNRILTNGSYKSEEISDVVTKEDEAKISNLVETIKAKREAKKAEKAAAL